MRGARGPSATEGRSDAVWAAPVPPEGSARESAAERSSRRSEGGHLLILLMTGLAVLMIMLTVAAQSWTFQMRREMEQELIFRGEQYVKGLDLYRKTNGGAFPVGDLKVLTKKHVSGIRFMRKLYRNPMDPNGVWQYLYLHPGGTGFINPCATGIGLEATDENGLPVVPVSGFPTGSGRRGRGASASFDRDRLSLTDLATPGGRRKPGSGPKMSDLTATDPRLLGGSGVTKMNLPIVGVVNCEMVESIRTYKAQTWLSNWAFTPLAQGDFAGNAQPGGAPRPVVRLPGGVGAQGSMIIMDARTAKAMREQRRVDDTGQHDDVGLERRKDRHKNEEDQPTDEVDPNKPPDQDPNAPPTVNDDEGDDEEDTGGDAEDEEDEEGEDGEQPPDPNHSSDPNHPPDPNQPSDPNQPPPEGGSR